MHVNGADASRGAGDDADIFRKTNVGLAYAAFDVGGQIGFALASEVHVHLAGADVQIQTSERNVAKMEISLACAHVHFQVQRDVFAEVKIPIVLRAAEMRGVGFLGDTELADTAGHAVVHARGVERCVVGEVRVKDVGGATVDGELSRAEFQASVSRFCTLQIHGLRDVL